MKSIRFNSLCRAIVASLIAVSTLELLPEVRAYATVGNPVSETDSQNISNNAAPAAIPRRASIILVVANGLGYGDLSCYGQTNYQTPNLDKLAAEGIRFTNYQAGGIAGAPAFTALMTGESSFQRLQHAPDGALVVTNENRERLTVAQVLKSSGYHTGWIGEWNLGDEYSSRAPWKIGFDEFAGYLNANDAVNFYADYMWRLIPDITYDESYNDPINGHWREWNKTNGLPTPGKEMIYANTQGKNQYIPDLLMQAALNFVKNNQPDKFNRFQPFILVLNCPIPGDGKGQVPTDAPFSNEKWPQAAKNRAAMIARLDGYVGQLAEQLQKLGLTNNVAVFFTSAMFPQKTDAVEQSLLSGIRSPRDLRVPMIVHWPGTIPAGVVSGYNWSAEGFLPTAAEIGFAKQPTDIKSTSILSVLTGRTQK